MSESLLGGNADPAATTTTDPAATTTTDPAATTTTDPAATFSQEAMDAAAAKALDDYKAEVAKTAPVVPDKYEFAPIEGVTFDDKQLETASAVFKELGLTQDQASKLTGMQAEMRKAADAKIVADYAASQEAFRKASETDKEYGGTAFKENVALAKKALDRFGTPELRTALDELGVGSHPEVVRAFVRIGKAMSEDGLTLGQSGENGSKRSLAQRLFPNNP